MCNSMFSGGGDVHAAAAAAASFTVLALQSFMTVSFR